MTAPTHERVLDAVVAPDHVVTAADPVVAAPEPETAHRRGVRWKSAVLTVLPPLVVAGVVVGLWSFITYVVLGNWNNVTIASASRLCATWACSGPKSFVRTA